MWFVSIYAKITNSISFGFAENALEPSAVHHLSELFNVLPLPLKMMTSCSVMLFEAGVERWSTPNGGEDCVVVLTSCGQ